MAFFKKVKCVECGFLINEREISRIIEKNKKERNRKNYSTRYFSFNNRNES